MKFEKNQMIELDMIDLSVEGMGIGKIDAYPFFVKDTLPGERIRAKVIKLKSKFGIARLVEIIEGSKDRVEPRCEIAKACGGCQLQHLDYKAQLKYKQSFVENNLKRIGQFDKIQMNPVLGMDEPWFYRNKSQFPVGIDKEGQFVSGFYQRGSHQIIPSKTCYIGSTISDQVRTYVLAWLEEIAKFKYHQHKDKKTLDRRYGKRYQSKEKSIEDFRKELVYDEATYQGMLRHIIVREARNTQQFMVCLVSNYEYVPMIDRLVKKLQEIDGFTSLSLNLNQRKDNVILGDKTSCLWGNEVLEDQIFDLKFKIHIESFYQVNTRQMEILYGEALKAAQISPQDVVWDVYCGIGTMSLLFAKYAQWVYGIEVVEEAILNAKENAKANHIDNITFFVGGAGDILPRIQQDEKAKPDVIVVDPPRKGCSIEVLEVMLQMNAKRIVYVSCDSATLARDLKILVDGGYKIDYVQPVDMFCHTVGIENVVKLSKFDI